MESVGEMNRGVGSSGTKEGVTSTSSTSSSRTAGTDIESDEHGMGTSATVEENPDWSSCNLIVNYLPHEIDDLSLKVSIMKAPNLHSQLSLHLSRSTLFLSLSQSTHSRKHHYIYIYTQPLHLQRIFEEHGEISVSKVVRDKITKKSLGYGFVKFVKEEGAVAAIEGKNGFNMGHKRLKVSLARPPCIESRNCKLYITNLPKEYVELDVTNLFSQVSLVSSSAYCSFVIDFFAWAPVPMLRSPLVR